jgi:recombination protein RecA
MDFLKDFKKDLDKIGLSEGSSEPPKYWYSTGNFVLNKVISGSVYGGIPQGRITGLVGPSGAGKSFIASNIMREAQKQGAYLVTLDSENALDDDFVSKIGVNVKEDYTYVPVDTIPQVQKVVSSFLTGYKSEYGDDPDAPQVLITLDSLDMLITETEEENFRKGVTKGDQGQRNKQLKAMLRQFVQAIKHHNIAMVVTDQVYKNQDVMNGEGVWMVKDAIKYSLSQVIMLTKLKLRETGSREVEGIRMKCEGYKTRFTKPFQTVTIEVPYDTGMDPYNGLLDVAVELDILKKGGSYFTYNDDTKFQKKTFTPEIGDLILGDIEAKRDAFLEAIVNRDDEVVDKQETGKSRRQAKFTQEEQE